MVAVRSDTAGDTVDSPTDSHIRDLDRDVKVAPPCDVGEIILKLEKLNDGEKTAFLGKCWQQVVSHYQTQSHHLDTRQFSGGNISFQVKWLN